ncbi:cyclodeaminase/cyclohydrolase family protein [Pseudarthrobacter sp. NIBRBAC000502770]|uniref:cyclodeaminase/cyclohydrolase family protein n=1 Tax=Pseudarthrobacter sp. NIBRBAC000502770 TaxID=2590785 RepID=UPI0011403620|nr:cyclodeaminase/cyclohydrolase family protein [Pseudarthrobacter sp. NIBRBAC000502770]QDG90277.1 cyclodeaminase/cyclohydrolase family protein [Pseudarthrobacter sp. NIBRBAC000502770]
MEEAEATTQGSTVEDWTRALAESTGSPGGGAGTGLMLAVAASLTSMVAGYSGGEDDGGKPSEIRTRAQALRREALQLADDDASASKAFGAAFRLEPGPERDEAVRRASLEAAASSAVLGERAIEAIDDLAWLATKGNRSLVADVVVAFGALRAAVAGARTNVSFDLGSLRSTGDSLDTVRRQQPDLWAAVQKLNGAMDRIDAVTARIDHRAAPTDSA